MSAARRRRRVVFATASALLVLAVVASLAFGARALSIGEVVGALFAPDSSPAAIVMWEQRVPRTILAVLVGAGLAVAGVIMQALTRNPLADPRIFGVASGASLGVVIGISVFSLGQPRQYVWFGVAGALAAGMAGSLIARAAERSGTGIVTFALTGAALDASLSALVYAVLTTHAQSFDQYRFWVVGSLAGRDGAIAAQIAPLLICGLVLAFALASGLDAMVLGTEVATGLGTRVGLVRFAGAMAVAVLTAAAVAAAGPIGFVGLAVPHLVRPLVGVEHRWVLTGCLLFGPALLLLADTVGRRLVPGEAPAGIVTALIGAPVLICLVRRTRVVAT